MNDQYQKLVERIKDSKRMAHVEQLLDWDQEVNMPDGGAEARAELLSLVAGLTHQFKTSQELGKLLDQAQVNGNPAAAANVREAKRTFDRATKVPTDLVKRIAHTSSMAKAAWAKARSESNFAAFAPWLEKLLDLKREEASCIGYTTEPYDALLDDFEPGAKSSVIAELFSSLRAATVPMLQAIRQAPRQPDETILTRHYPKAIQEKVCRRVAEMFNFDFNHGRADVSVHPFCTTLGPATDVRITTRYEENFLQASVYGTMHEVGHALYEQGFKKENAFTPMAEAVSMGIHESQSRMWENIVGRSREFCEFFFPELKAAFGQSLGSVSVDAFELAINAVRPSFIRVEADELTYNMHIVLRFEMERDLMSGKLAVRDVPATWNAKMKELLGITPSKDSEGCLQDIHWSMGGIGYFPTYALGNLYASQFYDKARQDIPDLSGKIRTGNLRPLLDWLRENIHQHGQLYRASDLVQRVTGKSLSIEPFKAYAKEKFGRLYGVSI